MCISSLLSFHVIHFWEILMVRKEFYVPVTVNQLLFAKNFRYFLKKPMIKLFAVTYFCDQALVDIIQEAIMRGIYWLVHGCKFSQQLKLKIFCKFFQHVNLSWFLENIFSMVSYLKFLKCHFISYIFFNSRTVGKNFHENVVWLLNKISTKIYEDSRTVLK